MKTKLRLLITDSCDRNCEGCCNKEWDLTGLPVVDSFSQYEIVMLTGGEPLLKPGRIQATVTRIRKESAAQIYIYTAMVKKPATFKYLLEMVDGITLTLHEPYDVKPFKYLCRVLAPSDVAGKSMRLNVFSHVDPGEIPDYWIVKPGMEWVKDCPLPDGEEFKRLLPAKVGTERAFRKFLNDHMVVTVIGGK